MRLIPSWIQVIHTLTSTLYARKHTHTKTNRSYSAHYREGEKEGERKERKLGEKDR